MNNLKELRIKLGLSRPKLCKLFNPPIPLRTWENYETEDRTPTDWIKGLIIKFLIQELKAHQKLAVLYKLDIKDDLTLYKIDNAMVELGYKSAFDSGNMIDKVDDDGTGSMSYLDGSLTEECNQNCYINIVYKIVDKNQLPKNWDDINEKEFCSNVLFKLVDIEII